MRGLEGLYTYIRRTLESGRTVTLAKKIVGTYATGYDLNVIIKFNDEKIADNVYKWKEWSIRTIEERFEELVDAIYEFLYNKALDALARHIGFDSVEQLEKEAEIYDENEGKIFVYLNDEKVYVAEFCKRDLQFFVAEDVETYVFHLPRVVEVKDC